PISPKGKGDCWCVARCSGTLLPLLMSLLYWILLAGWACLCWWAGRFRAWRYFWLGIGVAVLAVAAAKGLLVVALALALVLLGPLALVFGLVTYVEAHGQRPLVRTRRALRAVEVVQIDAWGVHHVSKGGVK